MQLLNVILYNNSEAPSSRYLCLLIRKSSCFKPWRRMPLEISALNQNNKRLSRLAIISKHVAADKRKRFGNVWVVFCGGEFSSSVAGFFFFYTCLFLLNATLSLHTVHPLPAGQFTVRISNVVLISMGLFFFFLMLMVDVRWEEPVAWWAPNVWFRWMMLIASDRWWGFCGWRDWSGLSWRGLCILT